MAPNNHEKPASYSSQHDKEDELARKELKERQERRSLGEKYNIEQVEHIVNLLNSGRKITKFNQFSGGAYTTELGNNSKTYSLRHQYPWPFAINGTDEAESSEISKEGFKKLLQEMKAESNDLK